MKVLFALLATTSFCYAASVGVSEYQLRGSHITHPPVHSGIWKINMRKLASHRIIH